MIAYPSFRDVLLETWPGRLIGLVYSTAQSLVLSLRMHACGMGKVDSLNEFVHEVEMGIAGGLCPPAPWLSQVRCRTFLRCNQRSRALYLSTSSPPRVVQPPFLSVSRVHAYHSSYGKQKASTCPELLPMQPLLIALGRPSSTTRLQYLR